MDEKIELEAKLAGLEVEPMETLKQLGVPRPSVARNATEFYLRCRAIA